MTEQKISVEENQASDEKPVRTYVELGCRCPYCDKSFIVQERVFADGTAECIALSIEEGESE